VIEMEEEIVVINGTRHTFEVTLLEVLEYREKRVSGNDFRVFDKDITPAKREYKIIIKEAEEQ